MFNTKTYIPIRPAGREEVDRPRLPTSGQRGRALAGGSEAMDPDTINLQYHRHILSDSQLYRLEYVPTTHTDISCFKFRYN